MHPGIVMHQRLSRQNRSFRGSPANDLIAACEHNGHHAGKRECQQSGTPVFKLGLMCLLNIDIAPFREMHSTNLHSAPFRGSGRFQPSQTR